jgi:transcriptional regulator with XRE-family HTH domain
MDEFERPHLNGETLKRARLNKNLNRRELSRLTTIRIAQLEALERGKPCELVTIGSLVKLGRALGIEPAQLLAPDGQDREPADDDVKVEALLAQVGKAVNRDDMAWALGWSIERTRDALKALDERLTGTGQRLRPTKFGWYGLGPAGGVISE